MHAFTYAHARARQPPRQASGARAADSYTWTASGRPGAAAKPRDNGFFYKIFGDLPPLSTQDHTAATQQLFTEPPATQTQVLFTEQPVANREPATGYGSSVGQPKTLTNPAARAQGAAPQASTSTSSSSAIASAVTDLVQATNDLKALVRKTADDVVELQSTVQQILARQLSGARAPSPVAERGVKQPISLAEPLGGKATQVCSSQLCTRLSDSQSIGKQRMSPRTVPPNIVSRTIESI